MTKKERALAAMKFKTVDRIPTMYRGVMPFSKRLMDYLKIGDPNDPILLPRNHKKLLKKIGADLWTCGPRQYFSNFFPKYIGPELDYLDQAYFCTMGIKAQTEYIEKYDYSYLVYTSNPLSEYGDPKKVKGFLTKRLDFFDYKNCINQQISNGKFGPYFNNKTAYEILNYKSFKDSDDDIISIGDVMNYPFILCSYLRGMDNFLLDMVGNVKMAEAIVNEVCEFLLEFNKRLLNETTIKADVYSAWDDVASQENLMFSPILFKKYFLPYWKKIIFMAKSKGLIFSWHCCGNINEVLPMMIDAGIDVFDVVQTSAKDMEIERFHKRFGKNVCINGAIDVQKLLIDKKPKDIREEVKKIMELWGQDGGAIIGPSHEILPETPIENVLAIYEVF
ncbi:MAG: uroporphyrinogen decarboxylase family protein [Candidatus Humimicrobiaceae bacterium]